MSFCTIKSFFVSLLIATMVSLQIILPVGVHAQVPFLPVPITGSLLPGPEHQAASNVITDWKTLKSTDFLLKYILEPAARAVIRATLTALVQEVVNWISADGGNNVGYVGNFERTLTNELDNAGGEILGQLPYIDFCGDIGAYLKLNLRVGAGGLRKRAQCSLTAIVRNVQNFYDNFQNGGWEAFLKTNVDIQNNTAGAFLITLDAKVAAESRRKESFIQRYQQSMLGGVLGTTKGATNCVPTGQVDQNGDDPLKCTTETVVKTPGRIIEDALDKANGTGFDFGVNAKFLDEAIASIINALLKRTISASQGIFGGGSNYNSTPLPTGIDLGAQQTALRRRIDAAVFLAYGTQNAIDAVVLALRAELAGPPPPTASREGQIKASVADLLAKKLTVAALENQLIAAKQSSFNAATLADIAAIDQQITQIVNQINPIAAQVGASPYATPAGDMKTDALNDISGARAKLLSLSNLINQAIAEIDAALSSGTLSATNLASLNNYRTLLTNSATLSGGALQQLQNADTALQNEYDTIQGLGGSSEVIAEIGNAISVMTAANNTGRAANTLVRDTFSFIDSILGQVLTTFPPPIVDPPPPPPT